MNHSRGHQQPQKQQPQKQRPQKQQRQKQRLRDPQRASRRTVLSLGAAAGLGLTLPQFFRLREAAASAGSGSFGSAKHVIFIFLHGGHPQHETWDPKPQAPAEIRGEFGDLATAVPGLRFGELFPRCAQIADRLAVIRSMAHENTNHVQACLPAMTGHKHPPSVRSRGDFPPARSDFPHFGAVLAQLRGGGREVPAWVQLGPTMTRSNGTVLHGQSPGFLGDGQSPLVVDEDFTAERIPLDAVSPRIAVSRMRSRRDLLRDFDAQRMRLEQQARGLKDAFYERAYRLLTSRATRDAFDLSREPAGNRERYPQDHVGQACLLARRLVEAGVPFINVHWCRTPRGSWDTHGQNFSKMKQSLGPTLDQAFSTLVLDLEERGLLNDVLVVPMAEFGRTPKINKNAGRDHWPFVYSLAMAGAGLARGALVGESDRLAAYPKSAPHDPADMAATLYHLLGIPKDTVLRDPQDRPHRLIVGNPITELLG